jgi:hypothetical protein
LYRPISASPLGAGEPAVPLDQDLLGPAVTLLGEDGEVVILTIGER